MRVKHRSNKISRLSPRIHRRGPLDTGDLAPGGIYARLEESGHRLARFTEEVTARIPTPDDVRSLRLDAGVPVIALVRTAIDDSGTAVELCETVMAADRFVLEYELPAR